MEHAQRISAEDADSRIERAKKQRDIFFGQAAHSGEGGGLSLFDVIGGVFHLGKSAVVGAFNALKPTSIKQSKERMVEALKKRTYGELLLSSMKLGYKGVFVTLWFFFMCIW